MQFDTLKQKQEYYRKLTDYRLLPNSYVIVMLDGRSFSKKVKNKFRKPFDSRFVNAMNETTKYLCEEIEGCKFGYCQSDEISLVLTDFETPTTDSFFGYRLSKILSICASAATAKFNACMLVNRLAETNAEKIDETIQNNPLYEFDCKAWNVPTLNDVYGWVLYRQLDCIRNSKQQTAQTWLSHNQLIGLNTDEQISKLKQEKCVDWETFNDDVKYGRFIYRELEHKLAQDGTPFDRMKFHVHPAFPINTIEGKQQFLKRTNIPELS